MKIKLIIAAVTVAAMCGAARAAGGALEDLVKAVPAAAMNNSSVSEPGLAAAPSQPAAVQAGGAAQLGLDDIEIRTTAPDPDPERIHFLIPTQGQCGEFNLIDTGGLRGLVGRAKQILAGRNVDVSHVAVDGWGIVYMTTSARVKESLFEEKGAPVTLGDSATRKRMVKKIRELLKSGAVITSCGVFLEPRYGNGPALPVSIIPQRHSFRIEYLQ